MHFIQSGFSVGGGHRNEETVAICENCGQFRVCAMEDGVWTEVRFSIWDAETLALAGKPLESATAALAGRA